LIEHFIYEVRYRYSAVDSKTKEVNTYTRAIRALDINAALYKEGMRRQELEEASNVQEIIYLYSVCISPNGKERKLTWKR